MNGAMTGARQPVGFSSTFPGRSRTTVWAAAIVLTLCVAVAADSEAQNGKAGAAKDAKPGAKTGEKDETVVLRRLEFKDPEANNMVSHTMLVPAGWTVEGGTWNPNPQCFRLDPSQDIKVASPEGVEIRFHPNVAVVDVYLQPGSPVQRPKEYSIDDGYPVYYFHTDLNAWKKKLEEKDLKTLFPKGKKFTIKDLAVDKGLTALQQEFYVKPTRQALQEMRQAPGCGMACDGAVWVAYGQFEEGGKTWDVYVIHGMLNVQSDFQPMGYRKVARLTTRNLSIKVPAGTIKEHGPLLGVISNSLRTTPQWDTYVQEIILRRAGMDVKHAQEQSKIIRETQEHIAKNQRELYKSQVEAQSAVAAGWSRVFRGVEDYVSPDGETTMQASSQYERVFMNSRGEYLLTDSKTYDPNEDKQIKGVDWQALKRVQVGGR